jgi:hypothetical protein
MTDDVTSAGGSLDADVDGAKIVVQVPPGAVTATTQVALTAGPPSGVDAPSVPGGQATLVIAISLLRDGAKLSGLLPEPISVTITDSQITALDEVLVYDPTSGDYVEAADSPFVSNVNVAVGTVTLELIADPAVAIEAPGTVGSTSGAQPKRTPSDVATVAGAATSIRAPHSPAQAATASTTPPQTSVPTSSSSISSPTSPSAPVTASSSPSPTAGPATTQPAASGSLAFTGSTPLLIWLLVAGAALALIGATGRRTTRAHQR